jgi:hypothetical protein
MALLYLSNLFINNNVSFRNAENDIEKGLSTYAKFKYEQGMLSTEFGLYLATIIQMRGNNPLPKNNTCNYNFNYKLRSNFLWGSVAVLPFTIYRTLQYIKQNDIKFIRFN